MAIIMPINVLQTDPPFISASVNSLPAVRRVTFLPLTVSIVPESQYITPL